MDVFDQQISQFLLFITVVVGAVAASISIGMVIWTWRDMRVRSRDVLAQWAATGLVALLNVFGLLIYLMLRPRETLAEAYERSLEEEALLQGIEEKPICPGCGRAANAQWQVCPYCHTRLKKPCINCGQLLDLPWNLCPYCAVPQTSGDDDPALRAGSARPRRGELPPSRGKRRPQPQEVDESEALEYIEGDEA